MGQSSSSEQRGQRGASGCSGTTTSRCTDGDHSDAASDRYHPYSRATPGRRDRRCTSNRQQASAEQEEAFGQQSRRTSSTARGSRERGAASYGNSPFASMGMDGLADMLFDRRVFPAAWTDASRSEQLEMSHKQRWQRAIKYFHALPLEQFLSEEEIRAMSVRELKSNLRRRDVPMSGMLEKEDLVERLITLGGSTATTCSICAEEYTSQNDVLRVLPCGHRFHCECIDTWFLNPVQHLAPPSCPMCKQELPICR